MDFYDTQFDVNGAPSSPAPQKKRGVRIFTRLLVFFFLVILLLLGGIAIVLWTQDDTSVSGEASSSDAPTLSEGFTRVAQDAVRQPSESLYDPRDVLGEHRPTLGAEDARFTIVEFSDFECPFCRRAFPIMRELLVREGGRIRFVYRHFPVESLHASARQAAEASECALAQDEKKFWAFHDKIFQYQEDISQDALKEYAASVGLDTTQLSACVQAKTYAARVQNDLETGVRLGVQGTPTWFVIVGSDVRRLEGVFPFTFWLEVIEQIFSE